MRNLSVREREWANCPIKSTVMEWDDYWIQLSATKPLGSLTSCFFNPLFVLLVCFFPQNSV